MTVKNGKVIAYVQALEYAGWLFPKGKYKQLEDNLAYFILTDQRVKIIYDNDCKKYIDYMSNTYGLDFFEKCSRRNMKK